MSVPSSCQGIVEGEIGKRRDIRRKREYAAKRKEGWDGGRREGGRERMRERERERGRREELRDCKRTVVAS